MLTIQVNGEEIQFDLVGGQATLNGKAIYADPIKLGPDKYHILLDNRSITLELLEKSENGKELTLLVNGIKQVVIIRDRYDALLSQLGMDKLLTNKNQQVKAPMPGLVLRLLTEVGQHVKKGDPLLVLEAMKMENVIKAERDGTVKSIAVTTKQAVEKNTVLMEME